MAVVAIWDWWMQYNYTVWNLRFWDLRHTFAHGLADSRAKVVHGSILRQI